MNTFIVHAGNHVGNKYNISVSLQQNLRLNGNIRRFDIEVIRTVPIILCCLVRCKS